MGDSQNILIMLGLGYLLYKTRAVSKTVGELRTGESTLYSPYTQRYFNKYYSRVSKYTLLDRAKYLDLGEY